MQSRSLNINIVPPILQVHQGSGVRVAAACRASVCSLLFRIINDELTVLSAWLTPPPPRLTLNKYYISQDSIDFRVVLSMSCLRALRFARSTSSRAFFIALGSIRGMLSLPLFIFSNLISSELSLVGAVANRDSNCDWIVVGVFHVIL